jgi:hypothetical protein
VQNGRFACTPIGPMQITQSGTTYTGMSSEGSAN